MAAGDCVATVVTPVFNSAPTLRRAAASALAQTLRDIELLIVDDGSTDQTPAVIQEIAAADPRVRVLTLPRNGGKPHAMNRAIEAARGRWLAVLDADDRYRPNRLELMIGAAEAAGVELVADNQWLFDAGAGRVLGAALPQSGRIVALTEASFSAGCDPYASFDLGMLKPVVRTDFVRRTGLAYRESAKLAEDFLFLAEFLAAGGRAILVEQPLYIWTQAFGAVSRQWTENAGGPWRYDFASAVAAHREVRAALAARGSTNLVRLLDRRARAFRRLHFLTEANRLRAEGGSVMAAACLLAWHPSAWPLATSRMVRAWRMGGHRQFGLFEALHGDLHGQELAEPPA